MTEEDREAADVLAQKVFDMVRTEGQRLIDNDTDSNSANEITINAIVIALANVCHFTGGDGDEVIKAFRGFLRDIKRQTGQ